MKSRQHRNSKAFLKVSIRRRGTSFTNASREITAPSASLFSPGCSTRQHRIDQSAQWPVYIIDLVTVFDAILTSRQTREKLQCLYENLMSNNFRKTAVLTKIWFVNWYHDGPWLPASDNNLTPIAKPIIIPFIPEQKKQSQIEEHIISFLQRIRFYCVLLTQRQESIIFPP